MRAKAFLPATICIFFLLVTNDGRHCWVIAGAAFTHFTSGQQLLPRYYPDEFTVESPQCNQKWSVWDLPRVEQWASDRNLTASHIKTIYRMATSYVPKALQMNYNDEQMLHRLLYCSFPRQHAHDFVQKFSWKTIQLIDVQQSFTSNGNSVKMVCQLPLRNSNSTHPLIETVIIRHSNQSAWKNKGTRYTVCISSQVGCTRACTFCATGTQMKFQSHLSCAEIVEQVYLAQQVLSDLIDPLGNAPKTTKLLRNIVFMGMGEPLDNWSQVYEACRTLTHQCILDFNPRHITVSTVGVTPNAIRQMAQEAPTLRLAVSLHAALQVVREQLMPAAKFATLEELESALNDHIQITGQYCGPMIEYLLIDGVNDSDEAVQALIDFCGRLQLHPSVPPPMTYVNLIPYNPTFVGQTFHKYDSPSDSKILDFHKKLLQSGIIKAHVRWSSMASQETNGACGQLALLVSKKRD